MDRLGSQTQPNKQRRRHTLELKREVVAACAEPGRAVASVARLYQINANMVHKWRRELGQQQHTATAPPTDFIRLSTSLSLPSPVSTPSVIKPITVELPSPRGPIILHWPSDQLDQLAQWLRTVLA